MPEEPKKAKGSSKMVGTIITLAVVIIVPAVLALAAWFYVVRPMVSGPAPSETAPKEEEVKKEESLALAVAHDFKEAQVSVAVEDPQASAPLLIFQVSFVCNSAETAELVKTKESLFVAMLLKLHSNRTRSELNDPYVCETILRQAKQEANALLKRVKPAEEEKSEAPEPEVLEVMHIKFAIIEL
jgi:flagellar basal body-associated protein FliL